MAKFLSTLTGKVDTLWLFGAGGRDSGIHVGHSLSLRKQQSYADLRIQSNPAASFTSVSGSNHEVTDEEQSSHVAFQDQGRQVRAGGLHSNAFLINGSLSEGKRQAQQTGSNYQANQLNSILTVVEQLRRSSSLLSGDAGVTTRTLHSDQATFWKGQKSNFTRKHKACDVLSRDPAGDTSCYVKLEKGHLWYPVSSVRASMRSEEVADGDDPPLLQTHLHYRHLEGHDDQDLFDVTFYDEYDGRRAAMHGVKMSRLNKSSVKY